VIIRILNWLSFKAAVFAAGYLLDGFRGILIALICSEVLTFLLNVLAEFKPAQQK
jgi:hypothetical protein